MVTLKRSMSTEGETLQFSVLSYRSTLGYVADVNPVNKFLSHTFKVCGRNLITGLTSAAVPRVDISSTCKVGHTVSVI